MDAIRQYIISITGAAILCGVIKAVVRKGPGHGVIKILCGTFLAFSFISPLASLSIESLEAPFIPELEDGRTAAQEGADISREAMKREITERITSVIQNKAREFGAEVTVEVNLSEDTIPVPVELTLSGAIAPYARVQLKQYICTELAINEEAVHWNG